MLSFQQSTSSNGPPPIPSSSQPPSVAAAPDQPPAPSVRLREEPPPITPAPRNSRKRKSPPSAPPQLQHVLPPPHTLMHPIPGPLPGYSYPPADYTPGGLPPGQPPQPLPPSMSQQPSPGQTTGSGRTLSQSKRAEQNRKAQRAFRERRDQHVKALESRSQLLDAALASADEANRRWEECRALVDQLRVENAALRAALSQAQMLPPPNVINPSNTVSNSSTALVGAQDEKVEKLPGDELKRSEPRADVDSSSKD